MPLYACAALCCKQDGTLHLTCMALLAVSPEEATGKALGVLKNNKPYAEGWLNYEAQVVLIPDEFILRFGASILNENGLGDEAVAILDFIDLLKGEKHDVD